jgi:hypothetical protein
VKITPRQPIDIYIKITIALQHILVHVSLVLSAQSRLRDVNEATQLLSDDNPMSNV